MSLNQVQFVRTNTLKLASGLDEKSLLTVPEGFNNNQLWNLGHIYVVHENLIFRASGRETVYPEGYVEAFKAGTKPADWEGATPTQLEDIVHHLEAQALRIQETFEGHLEDDIPQPIQFPGFSLITVRDLLGFAAMHEAMHATTVRLYSRLFSR